MESRHESSAPKFQEHQHQPSLTSEWLTLVPSGRITSKH